MDRGCRGGISLPVRIDRFAGPPSFFLPASFQEEGGDVGGTDGSVYDQDQNEPIPDGFERRVMKNRPAVMAWHL